MGDEEELVVQYCVVFEWERVGAAISDEAVGGSGCARTKSKGLGEA